MVNKKKKKNSFSELPEPWKESQKVKHEIIGKAAFCNCLREKNKKWFDQPKTGDKYMDVLERYIDQLSLHVRKIQDEELAVTNQVRNRTKNSPMQSNNDSTQHRIVKTEENQQKNPFVFLKKKIV